MRQRLIAATIESLVEQGHARTTAVEVCRRAGVTRGALHHHFPDLASLLAAAMSDTYERFFLRTDAAPPDSILALIDQTWERLRQPQFKAVIEVWLAARNNPGLAGGLQPEIETYARILSVGGSGPLNRRIGESETLQAFCRLCVEAMIGLALGRATTPGGAPLAHEAAVIAQLRELSSTIG